MKGLINRVLGAVFAVFALLGVSWALVGPGAGTAELPAPLPTLHNAQGTWTDAGDLRLTVNFHNTGQVAHPGRFQYEVKVGGTTIAQGATVPTGLPSTVQPGVDVPFQVLVKIDPEVGSVVWDQLAGAEPGKGPRLAIDGKLTVKRDGGSIDVPLRHRSQAAPDLAAHIASTDETCSRRTVRLCLTGVEAAWSDDALMLDLAAANQGERAALIENATVTLDMAGVMVAQGTAAAGATVGPDGTTRLLVLLDPVDGAGAAWWESHAEACESSDVELQVRIRARSSDGDDLGSAVTSTWTLRLPDYTTDLACQRGA